jgi:phytoene/squalene synthetase
MAICSKQQDDKSPMRNETARLGRQITREASQQAYYTGMLLVDRAMKDDFYRAYAYCRWVDDVVDDASAPIESRISFIRRQKEIVAELFEGSCSFDLSAEEQMVADLIRPEQRTNPKLRSFVDNMLETIEFDAIRPGKYISDPELTVYSDRLGLSVTDGLQYFIGHGHPYPEADNRVLAARGAQVTHLLRDMHEDIADGIINIPGEYLEEHGITPRDVNHARYREWVKGRVELARQNFREGKRYLIASEVFRMRIAGLWYCARFESLLDTIESEDYVLRDNYSERRHLAAWLRVIYIGIGLCIHHVTRRFSRQHSPK